MRCTAFRLTGRSLVARKPNYKFEKIERERAKAAKKAARAKAKAESAENEEPVETEPPSSEE